MSPATSLQRAGQQVYHTSVQKHYATLVVSLCRNTTLRSLLVCAETLHYTRCFFVQKLRHTHFQFLQKHYATLAVNLCRDATLHSLLICADTTPHSLSFTSFCKNYATLAVSSCRDTTLHSLLVCAETLHYTRC